MNMDCLGTDGQSSACPSGLEWLKEYCFGLTEILKTTVMPLLICMQGQILLKHVIFSEVNRRGTSTLQGRSWFLKIGLDFLQYKNELFCLADLSSWWAYANQWLSSPTVQQHTTYRVCDFHMQIPYMDYLGSALLRKTVSTYQISLSCLLRRGYCQNFSVRFVHSMPKRLLLPAQMSQQNPFHVFPNTVQAAYTSLAQAAEPAWCKACLFAQVWPFLLGHTSRQHSNSTLQTKNCPEAANTYRPLIQASPRKTPFKARRKVERMVKWQFSV